MEHGAESLAWSSCGSSGTEFGPGRWRAPLGVQAPRIESWGCCEAGPRVRAVRCSTTVSNCSRNRVPAAAIPEANPGVVVAEAEGSGLGVVLGARAELRRWLAVTVVKRGDVTTAAWILCTAELGKGRGTRAAAAVWRRGSQKGVTGHLRRGPGILGGRAGRWRGAVIAGVIARGGNGSRNGFGVIPGSGRSFKREGVRCS